MCRWIEVTDEVRGTKTIPLSSPRYVNAKWLKEVTFHDEYADISLFPPKETYRVKNPKVLRHLRRYVYSAAMLSDEDISSLFEIEKQGL